MTFTVVLISLLRCGGKIQPLFNKGDKVVFCGDYIDRGSSPYGVVEFLSRLQDNYEMVFLQGNHEMMFEGYLRGDESMTASYLFNGGEKTIRSYSRESGSLYIPESHASVLFSHRYMYEAEDFYVVHAGF